MMFKIPIEQYENEIDENFSKETKEEIINLFSSSIKFRSEKEFRKIERLMHEACKLGDADLIKIYLNETIENSTKDLLFKIDRTSKTASLFKVRKSIEQLIVPRTVQHESTEYLITSITGIQHFITTIKFVKDSAVKTIYSGAFLRSRIEEIYFPSSLRELREKWCHETYTLKKIIISPSNGQFIFKDDKYLLGKIDQNNDEFDILLFARRDIEKISIPSNVKIISSYAFENCNRLTQIEIPPNSNLQTIGSHAFEETKIEEIYFPSNLRELKEKWCYKTNKLKKIMISPSNGQFIFKDDKYLLGKIDQNNDEFDILLFARRDIEKISIPSNVKIISSYAFENCDRLTQIEIPPNSNLQTIGKFAFSCSKIEEIYFPSKLRELKEGWCFLTNKLKRIIVSPSNSQFILKDGKYLLGKTDPKSNEFDNLLFANRDIEEISIPSNIKIITSFSLQNCINLRKVEIPPNSNLQTIGSFAFSHSKIEEIFISSKVTKICSCAFNFCSHLSKVQIATNSNLQIIESLAFIFCNIKSFFIPSSVSNIGEGAFACCLNLQIVEFSEKSEIESLLLSFFSKDSKCIIMIPSSLEKLIHKDKQI